MPSESVAFDRAVDYYDDTRGFPPGEEKSVAALISRVGNFSAASRLLEIGVGTGRIALPVSAYVRAYFGVDISRPMMQRLRAKQNGEPVIIAQADATRLPFPAAAFDGAVAVHVFHLIPAWRQVLVELARVLRPGAPLVHTWSKQDDLYQNLWDAWNAVIPQQRRDEAGVHWKRNAIFLEDEGWQPAGDAQQHTYSFERSPLELLAGARKRLWSSTWRLTDEEIERGAAAMQAAIETQYAHPEQPQPMRVTVLSRAYLPPG